MFDILFILAAGKGALILKSRGEGGIEKRRRLRPLRKICTTVKSMYIGTIASYFEQVFVCWIPILLRHELGVPNEEAIRTGS